MRARARAASSGASPPTTATRASVPMARNRSSATTAHRGGGRRCPGRRWRRRARGRGGGRRGLRSGGGARGARPRAGARSGPGGRRCRRPGSGSRPGRPDRRVVAHDDRGRRRRRVGGEGRRIEGRGDVHDRRSRGLLGVRLGRSHPADEQQRRRGAGRTHDEAAPSRGVAAGRLRSVTGPGGTGVPGTRVVRRRHGFHGTEGGAILRARPG